jgi:porphobilinogen deaminase
MTTLRVATRGSQQALTQARAVAAALAATHDGLQVDLVTIETTGDRRTDVPLHSIGGQGVFVKEVQQAVLDGRADLAVHSAKDLPSTPTVGLRVGAWGRCVAGRSSRRCAPISASSSCAATSPHASPRCHRVARS